MMSQLQPQLSHFNTEKLIASESCDRYYNFIENSGLSNTDYMKKKNMSLLGSCILVTALLM